MPVFEQGYRRYVGERTRKSRPFAMAWENVRPRMRWWVWLLLFVLLFWPYLVHAGIILVAGLTGMTMPGAGMAGRTASEVAFDRRGGPPDPSVLLGMLSGNSLRFYWEVLDLASFQSLVLPAIVGAGLLASDRRTGALQIYFARPVTRVSYLLAKIAAASFFVALTTVVPCLLLWLETIAFRSAASFTWKTWIAPLVIAGASSFYALWSVGIVMAFSAVMRRPAFVAIASIFVHLAAEGIGGVLANSLREPAWRVIQPSYAIASVTAPLCGLSLPPWIDGFAAFGIALGIPLLLLAFVWWRVRAVEVVT